MTEVRNLSLSKEDYLLRAFIGFGNYICTSGSTRVTQEYVILRDHKRKDCNLRRGSQDQ